MDDDQGITYENAEQVEIGGSTYTNVNFTRPTRSTDEDDLSLDNDGIYILLAWGMEVNYDGSDPMSIAQHSMSGRAVLPDPYTFFRCGGMMIITNCKHKGIPSSLPISCTINYLLFAKRFIMNEHTQGDCLLVSFDLTYWA